MYKKFVRNTLMMTVALLIICGSAIFAIDPYYHYHTPWFGLQATPFQERYCNAGLAEHFDYDSVIIGSSMTENFRASWFDEAFGCKTMKLSYSGARSINTKTIMEKVFEHGGIRNVFFGLDTAMLTSAPDFTQFDIPEYLYDGIGLNDVNYLLNKDILFGDTVKTLQRQENFSFDDMYVWEKNYTFSEKEVLYGKQAYVKSRLKTVKAPIEKTALLQTSRANLGQNILPFIQQNPDTTFYLFVPPYSILFWDMEHRKGETEALLYMLEDTAEQLFAYPNVRLFYYQNVEEIVTDLNNYKDYSHYSSDVNRYIVRSMREGTHQMTKENYRAELQRMKELAENFDYEQFFH